MTDDTYGPCYACGAPGRKIGDSYGSYVVVHCTKCMAEWETVDPQKSAQWREAEEVVRNLMKGF